MRELLYTLMILLILGSLLNSCRTQYIPVETVRTEFRTRDSIRYDSIYHHDSVDTVYLYKYKYLYKYQYVNKIDTLMQTDSIQVPYPVEKQLSKWQRFKLDFGGIAMCVVIGIIIIKMRNLKK